MEAAYTSMDGSEIDAERLSAFLLELRSLTPSPTQGLQRFFGELQGLARQVDAAPTTTTVDLRKIEPSTLRSFFAAVKSYSAFVGCGSGDLNVWAVTGLRRDEVRNAAVLGWLFDSRQSHGCGASVLNALLGELARHHEGTFPIPLKIQAPYRLAKEFYSFGDRQNRVDLMIDSGDSVIAIEVKIGATERPDQVRDYLSVVQVRASSLHKSNSCVIYMTPDRRRPGVVDSSLILCSWKDVAQAIRAVVAKSRSYREVALLQLADHFGRL